ncbi:unnamed protein product [Caenorhabditis angaria]|uniref:Uncharacterized protein n=1 Tax=Caenorhabditis angaria TaxID=860376 RepID=A0A9P1MTA9_9PELO|nr:unnamed protein product [Caenorhabditis angaria]
MAQGDGKFLDLWQKSEKKFENQRIFDSPATTSSSSSSTLWSNFSQMSSSDQAQLMSKLSANWPFSFERRALNWPVHAGLLANCLTSSLIATRINSDMFLFDAKTKFLESVRKCPKSPFVFGVYSSGVTYYMLYQMLITPKIFSELDPCPSCLVINSIAIGLTTGVAIPMLATPYLAHYVLINRDVANPNDPHVKNLLEFITLGWEGSKPARQILPKIVALQMVVAYGAMYALLWGRERMYNTLDLDPELSKKLIADAQNSTSLKSKIFEVLRKIPVLNGFLEESPENQRHTVNSESSLLHAKIRAVRQNRSPDESPPPRPPSDQISERDNPKIV